MNEPLADQLRAGIAALGVELPDAVQEKLLHFIVLLQKWNRVYNLTAVRDAEQMLTHHLLDSLSVLPHLWPGRWLDVGCGGGLPGLVLAMARPDWHFELLDSNSKKTGFVQQAIIELGITNAEVHCARVEDWKKDNAFDGIISRAFAEAADFVSATRHLLAPGGRWAAMKGQAGHDSKPLPAGIRIEQTIAITVPGLQAARTLLILGRN